MNKEKPLTWDELANIYDAKNSGRPARTLRMETIFEWAKKQDDRFVVDDEGFIFEKRRELFDDKA